LSETIKAHEKGEIGDEEFNKKKKEIARRISEIKAQRVISRYKEPSFEPETYKTPPRTVRRPKPSRWWYLTPLFFNIFGGIIAYFAVRKDDYKMARNMLDFGGFMLLLMVVSVAILPGFMANFQRQEINATESNVSIVSENISNISIEKVFINNSLEEACQILGLFSNYTDLQKEDTFSSTYKNKYITWEGASVVAANKDSEGYILQLKHTLGCEIVVRINWDQRGKLLNIGKDDEIIFTARLTDYNIAGIFYATDGEIVI
ncbi:MAG: hypothetical protein ACE5HY_04245, partial [Candidatus Hydrothermarchaeales archaeon]